MESSTPASSSADDSNAQDPLALPNANESIGLYSNSDGRNQNGLCGSESLNIDKENGLDPVYPNDPSMKREEHPLNHEQRLQYDANHQMSNNYANNDQQKINHMNMQQNLHEPHKTFSHSIENLSKTTEKCAPNDIKIFPNLIDGHDQFDDGYETGVGDLLSNKYKLPTLPPPSSSPYSSLSSSSMSTISTATTTPTNLVNPQQQQSPSYMGGNGNAGNNMNQYQQQQQQQQHQQQHQQQQYHQNHQQQYQSMHPIPPSHQNSFNYHHMFGRIQQQQPQQLSGAIKNEPPMTPTDDPYRFVDDDLSNGHSSGMHSSINSHHHHMSPAGMSGNYSASSSPMPPQMQQQQVPAGNPSMMQFNDHLPPHHQHHMHGHHMSHMNHQQMQSQHMNAHLMNGNITSPSVGHGGMNPMLMNDTPKKRGRKKKLRDENGNPIEDRPVKERKKHDRFNGMPEEEVTKKTLPDHMAGNLDIVIVGINPGLFAAFKGHHYAGPGNHFWKCLYLSGLTSVQMTAEEDYKLLQFGIGFTNMVQRPTKGSADLTRKEIKEGSRILLEKIRKFQPKIAVFNGKLIFEVFSGKKDFCFGKQPETVEGTNTYMWVMPSSSARCAQLPRAADKVPFYAALKKFRDYLNGLVPEYDESDYVFNDPKYSQISTEAELKDETIAFTALEAGEVVMADPNKKKRGRPKKIRGENGEEIPTQKQRNSKNSNESLNAEGIDDDPGKKKRGRPKKNKDGTTNPATPKKKASSKQSKEQMLADSNSPHHLTPPTSVPPQGVEMNPMQHHNGIQHQQHPSLLNSNGPNINRPFLPPMESPTANSYNNGAISQQNHMQPLNHQQSQNASPVNLCFPPTSLDQVAQPEISPHHQQTYQQRQTPSAHQQQLFGANTNSSTPEIPSDMGAHLNPEQMTSPIQPSPSLGPQSEFEPPQQVGSIRSANEIHPYAQMQSTNPLEQQQPQHQTHSPTSQTHSPMGGHYPHQQHQQHQPQLSHMISNISNGSPYSPYARQHAQQIHQAQQQQHHQPQQQPSYPNHQQSPHHHGHANNNVNTKQMNPHNGSAPPAPGTDPFKDVATKSLSGLESLVDQIPNLNEQEAGIGSLTHTVTPHNGTPNLATSPAVASSSSLLPSLGPPHHHSHYPYTSHAAAAASQSPYAANPFSVSSLTSSTYPSAAVAMNSYHQNLMNSSHLQSSFMEPPHMPVPVTPLYHSYQQQGYPGYAPPHPSALHMSNYPYYTNSGYTQAPGSSYHHSMFDRINF